VRLVELDRVTDGDWQQVIAGEPQPFGAVGEELQWREKSHNLGLCDDAENLVALAGLVRAEVRVADARLQVAGIGGVIVTRAARGRGFARVLIERLLQMARGLGPERAMLFCLPANTGLYAKFGFQLIDEPVWAPQPGGWVQIPLCAMWRPLAGAANWPEGKIELLDEPF
jgi:GNAT superfamily N-acetyltransferase